MTDKVTIQQASDDGWKWLLVIALMIVLFDGDPDIVDAVRHAVVVWSGMK